MWGRVCNNNLKGEDEIIMRGLSLWWSSGPTEQSNLKLTNQNKKKQPNNNNNTTITRIVESRWSEISEEFNAFSLSLSLAFDDGESERYL